MNNKHIYTKDELLALHPAALLRKSVHSLLEEFFTEKSKVQTFENRVSAFLCQSLPAVAVYAVSESAVEWTGTPKDKRELEIVVDCIVRERACLDDELDALRFCAERLITYKKVFDALQKFFTEAEIELDFPFTDLSFSGCEIGMLADDRRALGCASISFILQYEMPKRIDLPDFITFEAGFDIAIPDGKNEIELLDKFPTTNGVFNE